MDKVEKQNTLQNHTTVEVLLTQYISANVMLFYRTHMYLYSCEMSDSWKLLLIFNP